MGCAEGHGDVMECGHNVNPLSTIALDVTTGYLSSKELLMLVQKVTDLGFK